MGVVFAGTSAELVDWWLMMLKEPVAEEQRIIEDRFGLVGYEDSG